MAGSLLAAGARTDPMAEGPPVRVLLLEAPQITVGAAGSVGLRLKDQAGRPLLDLDPGRQLRVRRLGTSLTLEPVSSAARGPTEILPGGSPQALEVVPAPGSLRQVPLQELRLEPIQTRSLVVVKQRRYRGVLLLRPGTEGLQAINRLPLESYLAGVVGSEMPGTWPLAALKAQAIASRTYALRQLRPNAPFDLQATVASQVYKGVEAESDPVRDAVISTRSQVLMYGHQLVNAVFHSSSGGLTENSGDLWSRQMPYLVSVVDVDDSSPVRSWEQTFTADALRQAFHEIGGAFTIQALETSKTGRLKRVKVIGPGGDMVLSGSALRTRLGLRSTLVDFQFEPAGRATSADPPSAWPMPPPPLNAAVVTLGSPRPAVQLVVRGRGFGHGVGMSQWGAYALALRGKSHEDILRHYYRGTIVQSY
jgi:stage II sporulation protein D